MKISCHNFTNVGYTLVDFTDEELEPIKQEINSIKDKFDGIDNRKNLAGNISKEFLLPNSVSHLENIFTPAILEYDSQFDYLQSVQMNTRDKPIKLDTPWVNFQRKHEFNPPHIHSGVFSFALWIDIPYYINEEMEVESSRESNMNVPGHFTFTYLNALGNLSTEYIPADKTWNNKALLFPSKMMHSVQPFTTSDDYRVSVSGNFKIDVDFLD